MVKPRVPNNILNTKKNRSTTIGNISGTITSSNLKNDVILKLSIKNALWEQYKRNTISETPIKGYRKKLRSSWNTTQPVKYVHY